MKRITTMKQVNDPWFLKLGVPFKKALQDCLVLQHNLIKTDEKKGRETYIFVHGPFFVEFTCNENFNNIRIKKQPHKEQVTEEDLNNHLYSFNVAFTDYRDVYGNLVEKFFTIVKNGVPVVYSYTLKTGDISEIELV